MKYLSILAILALVCAPVSAQKVHGKRSHGKAQVERVAKCEKECKCVCHKSKKADRSKDRKRGDHKRGRPSDRKRSNWRRAQSGKKVQTQRINRFRKIMEARKGTKHGLITK